MGRKLKMMGDNILVAMDDCSDKIVGSILYKPEGAYETLMRTGEVKAVGPGKRGKRGDVDLDTRAPVGVEVGDGVVFNRFVATHTKTAQALHQYWLEDNEAILKPSDVLLVYDRSNPVEFV